MDLDDLFHAARRSEESMSHLMQAATIFAEVGTEAGDMQPETWKLVEWKLFMSLVGLIAGRRLVEARPTR